LSSKQYRLQRLDKPKEFYRFLPDILGHGPNEVSAETSSVELVACDVGWLKEFQDACHNV